jgi:hypothetical protein
VILARTDVSEELSERASVASYGYVPSSPILVTLMMEALRSSETSVLARGTRRDIPEDAILYSHRSENLKSYEVKSCQDQKRVVVVAVIIIIIIIIIITVTHYVAWLEMVGV